MRRTGGVIPPGKAGLVMLAVAFLPVALKACKPLARAAGKVLKKAGEMAERIADNSQIDAKETAKESASATVAEEPKKAEPKKSAPKAASPKTSTPKKKPAPKAKPADAQP